ncbi:MAG: transglutaminase family protein [Henriciella sp.]|uniref:transglutaminase-like domain-containing protein n=1 Tax=Henriciella sp. TaxID=1968823 RepID=UPI0032EE0546
MRVKIDATLSYFLPAPTDVLLAVEALPLPDQTIVAERLDVFGPASLSPVEKDQERGRMRWMEANGEITLEYEATVDVSRQPVNLSGMYVPPRRELPVEAIPYLFPSRYCESDRLETFVATRFGHLVGGDQVLRMVEWIQESFAYVPGSSTAETTATDSFLKRQGVCRDYAHVLITFARAAGIPARMVSAYAPGLQPPDFHAVVEVWLDGAWRLVDPSRMSREDNLVRICSGRDATDISFMTIFGSANLNSQMVAVSVIEPAAQR